MENMDYFGEEILEPEVIETEPTEPTEPTGPEPATEPAPELITVKYNGEEKQITKEEAITLAQKGMNYDKILAERDSLRQSPASTLISDLAKRMNTTPEQAIEQLKEHMTRAELMKLRSQGIPDQVAQSLLSTQSQVETLKRQQETMQRQEMERERWNRFFSAFPDAKTETFTPETLQAIGEGKDPIDAYRKQISDEQALKIAELEQKLQKRESGEKAARKTPGSATGDGADVGDAFIDAYLKG